MKILEKQGNLSLSLLSLLSSVQHQNIRVKNCKKNMKKKNEKNRNAEKMSPVQVTNFSKVKFTEKKIK